MSQTIVLPWPDNKLSPNARIHYMAFYRAKKAYREACFWQAMEQGVKASKAEKLHIGLLFYKPSKRRMDIDNIFGRMKAGLDGLASVLKVDDSKFKISMDFAEEVGGFVRVTISEVA